MQPLSERLENLSQSTNLHSLRDMVKSASMCQKNEQLQAWMVRMIVVAMEDGQILFLRQAERMLQELVNQDLGIQLEIFSMPS